MSWDPQVGETWRVQAFDGKGTRRTYLLLQDQGQDSNYFHFVGLDLELGGTWRVSILNAPTYAWERLA